MATRMTDRLDTLYVVALDRDASLMHAHTVSACTRWCTPKTTHAQVQEFVGRQLASLEGLNDSLSSEVRGSWEWLSWELGIAPATAAESARVQRFRTRTATTAAYGRASAAA